MTDNIKRFPNGTAKPFLSPEEYSQLRDDDRFLYNEGIGMTSQTALEAAIQLIYGTCPDGVKITDHYAQAFARIEAEALARGRLEGAKVMQEAAASYLSSCQFTILALDPTAIVKGLNDAPD